MMRVAIVGANGQLGSDLCHIFRLKGDEVIALTHNDLELRSRESVDAALSRDVPDFIVNAAAMHSLEACEADPTSSFEVNALGPKYIAEWARRSNSTVAYISTDYVFDGAKATPYTERDLANPLNSYGITKLAGEHFTSALVDRHFVLRVSAIYGQHPCRAKAGLNFVELMLRLSKEREVIRVVDDEFVTPTTTNQIAEQIVILSRSQQYGIYHGTAEGGCSWFEFAKEIFAMTSTKVALERGIPTTLSARVRRPKYSVLENSALKASGLNVFTDWRVGLRKYLEDRNRVTGTFQ